MINYYLLGGYINPQSHTNETADLLILDTTNATFKDGPAMPLSDLEDDHVVGVCGSRINDTHFSKEINMI